MLGRLVRNLVRLIECVELREVQNEYTNKIVRNVLTSELTGTLQVPEELGILPKYRNVLNYDDLALCVCCNSCQS